MSRVYSLDLSVGLEEERSMLTIPSNDLDAVVACHDEGVHRSIVYYSGLRRAMTYSMAIDRPLVVAMENSVLRTLPRTVWSSGVLLIVSP